MPTGSFRGVSAADLDPLSRLGLFPRCVRLASDPSSPSARTSMSGTSVPRASVTFTSHFPGPSLLTPQSRAHASMWCLGASASSLRSLRRVAPFSSTALAVVTAPRLCSHATWPLRSSSRQLMRSLGFGRRGPTYSLLWVGSLWHFESWRRSGARSAAAQQGVAADRLTGCPLRGVVSCGHPRCSGCRRQVAACR